MIAQPQFTYLSPEAYLEAEEKSEIRHEYIDGQVFAMSGGTDHHNTITGNVYTMFRARLKGSGCSTFFSDMKARIEAINRYYYPDVMVTCDARDRETASYKSNAKLIVEVLSDSTEAFDRGDKFADYQQLESLQEYVLVSQKRQRVECFRRNEEGLWVLQTYQTGDQVHFKSVDLAVDINDIYDEVTFNLESSG